MAMVLVPGEYSRHGLSASLWEECPCNSYINLSDRRPHCPVPGNLSFESDGGERKDGIFTVHDAVSVIDEYIRKIGPFGAYQAEHCPYPFEKRILHAEVEEFCKGAQRVVVLRV